MDFPTPVCNWPVCSYKVQGQRFDLKGDGKGKGANEGACGLGKVSSIPHLAQGSRVALLPLAKVASQRSSRNFSQQQRGEGWEPGAVFCKRKETRGFASSPGTQRGGAPKSRKLHPEPQRPSEDSCEGLHHLSLKDDAVPLPPSPQSLEPKSKSG